MSQECKNLDFLYSKEENRFSLKFKRPAVRLPKGRGMDPDE